MPKGACLEGATEGEPGWGIMGVGFVRSGEQKPCPDPTVETIPHERPHYPMTGLRPRRGRKPSGPGSLPTPKGRSGGGRHHPPPAPLPTRPRRCRPSPRRAPPAGEGPVPAPLCVSPPPTARAARAPRPLPDRLSPLAAPLLRRAPRVRDSSATGRVRAGIPPTNFSEYSFRALGWIGGVANSIGCR